MTQAANLAALGTNAGTTGILPAAGGGTAGTGGVTGFKNRFINGNMAINQREFSGSITSGTNNVYTLDRWKAYITLNDKFTVSQNAGSVTPPVGFTYYLGATSSAATTVTTSGYYTLTQFIEGYNIADLGWGTANAKTVTLSFWVRSSLTGTFGGSLMNDDQDRSYPFTYTINAANTWEYETITIAGPTNGTWNTTNGTGLKVWFSLGVGSTFTGAAGAWASACYFTATGATSVVATNGATFYITGCQLEVGTAATNYDVRSYGTELGLCQRYYYKISYFNGNYVGTGKAYDPPSGMGIVVPLPVTMRTSPTGGYSAVGHFLSLNPSNSFSYPCSSITFAGTMSTNNLSMYPNFTNNLFTAGQAFTFQVGSDSAFITASAEL
jgi:hypothetical protein